MLPFVLSVARIPLMAGLWCWPWRPADDADRPKRRRSRSRRPSPAHARSRRLPSRQVRRGPSSDDDDDEAENLLPAVVPTARPARNQRRGYTIPKEPFILDPLL
jgi:hypothetical protein